VSNLFKREKKNKSPFMQRAQSSNTHYNTVKTSEIKSDDEESEIEENSKQVNLFDDNKNDNVKVVIRVRPLNDREIKSGFGKNKCVEVDNGTI